MADQDQCLDRIRVVMEQAGLVRAPESAQSGERYVSRFANPGNNYVESGYVIQAPWIRITQNGVTGDRHDMNTIDQFNDAIDLVRQFEEDFGF